MGQLFGTDGIRGVANAGLDAALAYKVGQAAAIVLAKGKVTRPCIAIGKDTRISSDMLEAALIAGICASGADVLPLGVVPTPAVAYITQIAGADAGVVISASHNPFPYNGIKIFNAGGFKLSDELELEIEQLVMGDQPLPLQRDGQLGRVIKGGKKYVATYIDRLAGMQCGMQMARVVVDCANGAASRTAGALFARLPVEAELINCSPNGININDGCGSTDTRALSETVVRLGCDMGIAFDGDADRCLIVDEQGKLIDGDRIMAVCGEAMRAEGKLKNNAIVATVMSNMGFHRFADACGIQLRCAQVGDRNVLEMMQQTGACLGGEQSGHLIFLDDSTTGDGQLAAIKFLNIATTAGIPVSELVARVPQFPQILKNVPVAGGLAAKDAVMSDARLTAAIEGAERALCGDGRVLVRPSGTEALIRVMVESSDKTRAETLACELSEVIHKIEADLKQ